MGGRAVTVLNVAEKPSVAKSVSTILSRSQGLRVRDGRSRYNKIFEFSYSIRGQPCHMLFTSVTGHLMELEFEERFRKWHSCDPADLYRAPVHKFVPEVKSTFSFFFFFFFFSLTLSLSLSLSFYFAFQFSVRFVHIVEKRRKMNRTNFRNG